MCCFGLPDCTIADIMELKSKQNTLKICLLFQTIKIYRHGEEVFTNMYPRIVPQDIFDAVKSKIDSNKYGKH